MSPTEDKLLAPRPGVALYGFENERRNHNRKAIKIIALAIIIFTFIGRLNNLAAILHSGAFVSSYMAFFALEALIGITMFITSFFSTRLSVMLGWFFVFLLMSDLICTVLGVFYYNPNFVNTNLVASGTPIALTLNYLDVPVPLLIFSITALLLARQHKNA